MDQVPDQVAADRPRKVERPYQAAAR